MGAYGRCATPVDHGEGPTVAVQEDPTGQRSFEVSDDMPTDPNRGDCRPGRNLALGGDRTPDNAGFVLDELRVVKLREDAAERRKVHREVVIIDLCVAHPGPGYRPVTACRPPALQVGIKHDAAITKRRPREPIRGQQPLTPIA